jgi:diphthine synthase
VLAGKVFADAYTAKVPEEALHYYEGTRKDEIKRLSREELESGKQVLDAAASQGAVLLVAGDPMGATTHVTLRMEAVRRGIPVHLLFAPSILHTAFSEAGLQHYKAGRVVSLPFPEKGFAPTSPFEGAAENWRAGLHTLVLLDLRAHEKRFMTANEALELIEGALPSLGKGTFGSPALAVVVAGAGEPNCRRVAGSFSRLRSLDYGPPMHCLILPGKLHFEEREALAVLCGAHEGELPPA